MLELVRQPGTTAASVTRDLDLTGTAAQPSHWPHAPRAACRERAISDGSVGRERPAVRAHRERRVPARSPCSASPIAHRSSDLRSCPRNAGTAALSCAGTSARSSSASRQFSAPSGCWLSPCWGHRLISPVASVGTRQSSRHTSRCPRRLPTSVNGIVRHTTPGSGNTLIVPLRDARGLEEESDDMTPAHSQRSRLAGLGGRRPVAQERRPFDCRWSCTRGQCASRMPEYRLL